MLNYLKEYNISDEQIIIIEQIIKDRGLDIDLFIYDDDKIKSILDLFISIGVKNIYGIMITNPSLFCDTIKSIENRINKYKNKDELAKLLNEDANNLNLVGLN